MPSCCPLSGEHGSGAKPPSLLSVMRGFLLLACLPWSLLAGQHAGSSCATPQARQFDFWIGEWDVLNRNRRPGDVRFHETGRATDRVYAVVAGCAIVEHWRGTAFGRHITGFSVRAFDPVRAEWDLVLLWPTNGKPAFGTLRGTFRHGRGEFFTAPHASPQGDTVLNRFTFSDVRPDALRWENGTSRDGGRSYAPSWIMEFTRRDPVTEGGLLNGVAVTALRCPGPAYRTFDPWLGEWRGTRADAGGDTIGVRVLLVPILEGCGVMERARTSDGSWRAFRIRAYEPGRGKWVEYAIDTDRPVLVRREGSTSENGGVIAFRDVEPGDGGYTRSVWTVSSSGLVITVAAAPSADGPWRVRKVLRLTERAGAP